MKAILSIISCLFLLLAACNKKPATTNADSVYYTCSMHPQVMLPNPGKCPICHMDLIKASAMSTESNMLSLSDEQILLGNIQVDTIGSTFGGSSMVLTSTITADETNSTAISSYVMGRIDRLYFKNMGDYVSKGAHLYDLYSEELNNAKQEYVALLEKKKVLDNSIIDFDQLIAAAKSKLVLWGMSTSQINALSPGKPVPTLTAFYSKESGYIANLATVEGAYVDAGRLVMSLVDLSSVWVEAQVYASQLPDINKGGQVQISVPEFPGESWSGRIDFVNPEINPETRINLARVEIQNQKGLLRPGMSAYMTLNSSKTSALTLPLDAVLRDGSKSMVWTMMDKNMFQIQTVKTGLENGNRIEILFGLNPGAKVVTSGAYLLYSELVFKKGADVNPDGIVTNEAHHH